MRFFGPHLRSTFIFVALVLGPLSGCSSGGGSDNNSDSTSRACSVIGLNNKIINGTTCANQSQAAVVRVMAEVVIAENSYVVPICSGSMVSPNKVLTAAHCLINQYSGFPIRAFGIFVGEKGAGEYFPGVQISAAPGYRVDPATQRIFDDAALITINQALRLPTLPILLSRSVVAGETGFVYGYGVRVQGAPSQEEADFGTLEAGAMTVQTVTPNHIFVSFDGDGVNVCNGDSGGPIVIEVQGQPAIAGVVSQGTAAGCVEGDITTFTNLQSTSVLSWLSSNVSDISIR